MFAVINNEVSNVTLGGLFRCKEFLCSAMPHSFDAPKSPFKWCCVQKMSITLKKLYIEEFLSSWDLWPQWISDIKLWLSFEKQPWSLRRWFACFAPVPAWACLFSENKIKLLPERHFLPKQTMTLPVCLFKSCSYIENMQTVFLETQQESPIWINQTELSWTMWWQFDSPAIPG